MLNAASFARLCLLVAIMNGCLSRAAATADVHVCKNHSFIDSMYQSGTTALHKTRRDVMEGLRFFQDEFAEIGSVCSESLREVAHTLRHNKTVQQWQQKARAYIHRCAEYFDASRQHDTITLCIKPRKDGSMRHVIGFIRALQKTTPGAWEQLIERLEQLSEEKETLQTSEAEALCEVLNDFLSKMNLSDMKICFYPW